ncbi:hypothetical protein LLG96_04655 [bacterium]|nr:hypothetical protein [bacterium]
MRRDLIRVCALTCLLVMSVTVHAEMQNSELKFCDKIELTDSFPLIGDHQALEQAVQEGQNSTPALSPAVWPFKKSTGNTVSKPKSPRKAFFLSLLLPGLGETYVGSKRGIAFLGVEAISWWMYFTNTNKGFDLEDDFRAFADEHWHYNDDTDSAGNPIDFNYWKWLDYKYIKDKSIGPEDYDRIEAELEKNADISVHQLPHPPNQQYYEMIGKYPQFVYGWEDIDDLNDTVRNTNGTINYNENIKNIQSDIRNKYEDMRYDSNKKLKAGQRGIHLMIINRVLSAIDAGRLAYHHNKKLNSELSGIQVRMVEKQIIDNKVPMVILTKKF